MRILIADDDTDQLSLMSLALKKMGHETVEAQDGQQAWALFQSELFPMVFTDWMMPKIDGPELIGLIRALCRERYTFIIMVTARPDRESLINGLDAGADDFVRKPFDPAELAARIRVAERILRLHSHVSLMEGLLSICAYCKRIRDDAQQWLNVDRYIGKRTGIAFSHEICPTCRQREEEKLRARR